MALVITTLFALSYLPWFLKDRKAKKTAKPISGTKISLVPLSPDDREQFILENQWSFKHGAMIEFGERDDHIDDDGEIISRETIEKCIDDPKNETYRIVLDGERVGGVILKIDPETCHNHLEILFVSPDAHSKGIGYGAWQAVEALHPETKIWETCTPYFEKRNIHFYVNKCGFQIAEFYNEFNVDPNCPEEDSSPDEGPDEMFRFIKVMK
ncbi:MAG: GNAT family N-acetyltransferase [Clostridia bacterium]|nr:GNAT family N-acetyltransferase [Clostridia bacterium]